MAVPIRTMVVGSIFALMLTYGSVGFFGSYQYSNHIAMNQTLAQAYNSIVLKPSEPGGIFSIGNLSSSSTSEATNIQNVTIFSAPGLAIQTLGYAAKFIAVVPALFYQLISFVAAPMAQTLHVPTGYVIAALTVLLITIIVLALLSALFIFPV